MDEELQSEVELQPLVPEGREAMMHTPKKLILIKNPNQGTYIHNHACV
jgi:hypothetical protein